MDAGGAGTLRVLGSHSCTAAPCLSPGFRRACRVPRQGRIQRCRLPVNHQLRAQAGGRAQVNDVRAVDDSSREASSRPEREARVKQETSVVRLSGAGDVCQALERCCGSPTWKARPLRTEAAPAEQCSVFSYVTQKYLYNRPPIEPGHSTTSTKRLGHDLVQSITREG